MDNLKIIEGGSIMGKHLCYKEGLLKAIEIAINYGGTQTGHPTYGVHPTFEIANSIAEEIRKEFDG